MNEFNIEGLSLVSDQTEKVSEQPNQEILAIVNEITKLSNEPLSEETKQRISKLQERKLELLATEQAEKDLKYSVWNDPVNRGGAGLGTK